MSYPIRYTVLKVKNAFTVWGGNGSQNLKGLVVIEITANTHVLIAILDSPTKPRKRLRICDHGAHSQTEESS